MANRTGYACIKNPEKFSNTQPECSESCNYKMSNGKCGWLKELNPDIHKIALDEKGRVIDG